jgi:hypothetical protein
MRKFCNISKFVSWIRVSNHINSDTWIYNLS